MRLLHKSTTFRTQTISLLLLKSKRISILLFVICFSLSSCFSILNSPRKSIEIHTKQPTSVIFGKDTLTKRPKEKVIIVKRGETPINITVFTDSLKKDVQINPSYSLMYYVSIHPNWNFKSGSFLDGLSKRKYTYPKKVFVKLNDTISSYAKRNRLSSFLFTKNSNMLKITLLKIVADFNPSIELSYERRTGKHFSTQLIASYLIPVGLAHLCFQKTLEHLYNQYM